MSLRYTDSPELQLWTPFALARNLAIACIGIVRDNPIFFIHELKIDTLKLLVAHHSFHPGNNFILLGSILDLIYDNLWRLREYRFRPWIDTNGRAIRWRRRVPTELVNRRCLIYYSLFQSRGFIDIPSCGDTVGDTRYCHNNDISHRV